MNLADLTPRMRDTIARLASAPWPDDARREPICSYLYDLAALEKHAAGLAASLPEPCRLYYAVKANPDPRLIAALVGHVAGFEAASIGEIRVIRAISRDAGIIFGGPGKKDAEIDAALDLGITRLHVESLGELTRVAWIAERRGQVVSILLRVNLDQDDLPSATVTMGGYPSQFGIDEALLPGAVAQAKASPWLALDGFHLHSLSNNLDAKRHAELVAIYLERVHAWAQRFAIDVKVVDAGGGFGVSYDERDDFDWSGFVAALAPVLRNNPVPGASLIFEPGRFISAFCGAYIAEVVDIKPCRGEHFALLRGGTHHFRLPASWGHDHPFEIVPREAWPYPFARAEVVDASVTLAGELCTPKDVLARRVAVPRLRVGDLIVFRRTGAYGWTISHHDFLGHAHPEMRYLAPDAEPGSVQGHEPGSVQGHEPVTGHEPRHGSNHDIHDGAQARHLGHRHDSQPRVSSQEPSTRPALHKEDIDS